MKIAMIGHKRVPSREGGVEIVVGVLSEIFAKRGHEVCIYNRNTGEKKLKEYKGAKIIEIPTPKKPSLNAFVYSVFATLRAIFGGYDCIHYHAEGPCAMLFLPHLLGIRTVATIHGLDWQRSKWGGFAAKYLMLGEKVAAKYADEVIVLSKSMQKYFFDNYGRKTVLIPNGIAKMETETASEITEKFGLKYHDYILYLARLTPEKGLDYLIDAFKETKTDKKLIIAGRCEPETEYIKSVKERIRDDDRIQMIGFVEGRTLRELFSNCYLYVLPSDVEGMPISLLEAIGLRARCLVSDIPENTQVAGGYAHTFSKGDRGSLRKKLEELLAKEKLYNSNFDESKGAVEVERQIDEIISQYDWENIADRTLKLYQK